MKRPDEIDGPHFDDLAIGDRFVQAPGVTLTEGHAAAHQAVLATGCDCRSTMRWPPRLAAGRRWPTRPSSGTSRSDSPRWSPKKTRQLVPGEHFEAMTVGRRWRVAGADLVSNAPGPGLAVCRAAGLSLLSRLARPM
jgi:hypothetical protein